MKWIVNDNDNFPDEWCIQDDLGNVICLVAKNDEYTEQNANLIAAAPDLLEACKDMLEFFNDCPMTTEWQDSLIEQAKRAISKAEAE